MGILSYDQKFCLMIRNKLIMHCKELKDSTESVAMPLYDLRHTDWLIIYGFTSRSRIFHLYGDVTIAGEIYYSSK
jgi:hypothetical protein